MPDIHTVEASLFFDPNYDANEAGQKCDAGKCDRGLEPAELARMEALD